MDDLFCMATVYYLLCLKVCGFFGKACMFLIIMALLWFLSIAYTSNVVNNTHPPTIIVQEAHIDTYKNHATIGPIAHPRSENTLSIQAIFPSSVCFFSIVLNRAHNEIPANSSPVVAINHKIINTIPKLHQRNIHASENVKSHIKTSFFLLYLSANLPIKNQRTTIEKSKIHSHIPISFPHWLFAIIKGTTNRIIE